MAMAMTFIGAAFTAWSLMQLIDELDKPKKNESRRCGNNVRTRCGR